MVLLKRMLLLLLLLLSAHVVLQTLVLVVVVLYSVVISIPPSPPPSITMTITQFNVLVPPTTTVQCPCTVILVLIFDSEEKSARTLDFL
jgi:hypothetical protein